MASRFKKRMFNTPRKLRPKSMSSTPPMRCSQIMCCCKKRPKALAPKPINVKMMVKPSTKAKALRTRRKALPSSCSPPK